MRRTCFIGFCVVFIGAATMNAQEQQRQFIPASPDLSATANLPLQRVGPEDLLGLQVYDAPEFTRTVRIAADGTIRMPMMKAPINVQGLFPNEIEILVAEAFTREKLFVDPFVTVNVVEYHSRPISVIGAVRSPVIFQAVGSVSLLDALARAGGLMQEVAGGDVVVTRPNGDDTQSVQRVPVKALIDGSDPQLNLKLVGGEEIRVPEVGKIVISGSVAKPGVYPVLDAASNTVTTAIAQAQGLAQFAAHTAYIYRPDDQGAKHEIMVDLFKILKRQSPDVTLQARDILYVPDSSGRRITATTLDRLAGFGASTASGTLIYHH
jgi:polysaccharide biosynthesis/export protein